MNEDTKSFNKQWFTRMAIILSPWVPGLFLIAAGAGIWGCVVGLGGSLLFGAVDLAREVRQRRRELTELRASGPRRG